MKNSLQLCWMKHISLFSSFRKFYFMAVAIAVKRKSCKEKLFEKTDISILTKRLNDDKTRSLWNHQKIKSSNKKGIHQEAHRWYYYLYCLRNKLTSEKRKIISEMHSNLKFFHDVVHRCPCKTKMQVNLATKSLLFLPLFQSYDL